MVTEDPARRRVNEAAERLAYEFKDRLSAQTVRELVEASFESYHGSRIKDFVPLLVYRSARERLGVLARTGPAVTSGQTR